MPLQGSLQKTVEWPANLDYKNQSIQVPGTKRPGQTAHYRNSAFPFLDVNTPGALTTLTEIFDIGVTLAKDKEFLGYRPVVSENPLKFGPFIWATYGQVQERRNNVGSALWSLFQSGALGGGEHETVGIWSANRPEWQIVDLALQAYKKVGVSLYDTLGKDSVEYIIQHSHLSVIFCSQEHIPALLKIAKKVPMLKLIVSMDDLTPQSKKILDAWAATVKLTIKDLREIEAIGKAHPITPFPATPNQLLCICYTSGTTSTPKGVLMRHSHMALATQASLHGSAFPVNATVISYLPLAHIYGRLVEILVMAVGGRIGYFTNDPLRLLDDVQTLRPEYFPSVPRVLNRVYQGAMLAGDVPNFRGAIFRKAVAVKLERLHATGINTHAFWDRVVFRKVRAVLGGNLLLVTSGSAPISPEVLEFLQIALCCEVTEGYGMTENCATCARTWPNDSTSAGTVGPPQPGNDVKLIDVPAMGYSSEDKPNPRGELCVRGGNCFQEYYKDEKNTKETVDAEGFIHTGDVAEIDSCGRIKIVDRVKNIMKLAQGEYVACEKIENLYSSSGIVGQLYVHGDSLQSYLVAVVVPDPIQLAPLVNGVLGTKYTPGDIESLSQSLNDPKVNKAVLAFLHKEAVRNSLKGFECIKRVHVTLDPFCVDDNTMTPTMKIRRKDAYLKHKAALDGLYAQGEPSSSKL